MASQTGANGKSKVFFETSPVTIDDKDFDRWVGNRLDVLLRPCPMTMVTGVAAGGAEVAGVVGGNQQALDYLALAKLLANTIGSHMMQFSQAISPQGGGI